MNANGFRSVPPDFTQSICVVDLERWPTGHSCLSLQPLQSILSGYSVRWNTLISLLGLQS